jgi:hypothetical protein
MTTVDKLYDLLEAVPSENAWRALSLESLEEQFVNPFLELGEEDYGLLIQNLSARTFNFWRKKLWTEQDIPEENDGYNRSMNVMIALKRSLLMRLPIIESIDERSDLTQQLARISLILNPMLMNQAFASSDEDQDEEDQ